ncbi:MAG: tol-pal system protein YbgF [Luteitalea sp.]|nr:tol-pal system protein YbgF [Luteitalea sp.]
MQINLSTVVLSLALVGASVAPAAAADKETRQMMADIRILQEQSQQLQNLLGALNESIKAVNVRIEEQTNSTRKSFADQKLVIDALTGDLRVVREKVDDSSVRVGSLSQELDALRQSVMSAAAAAAAAVPPPLGPDGEPVAGLTPPGDGTAAPVPTGAAAVGASPQKLFESARADYYAGQFDLAVLGFDAFLKTFPQAPQAPDAQVHIGHAYFQEGKYPQAIEAYDTLIRVYPKSSVVPDAYVRKGTALKSLGDAEKAREAFQFVIDNYPNTTGASIAQQRLLDLVPEPKR